MIEIIIPIITIVLAIAIVLFIKSSNGSDKDIYDERQTIETLKGYKVGFYAMLIIIGIYIIALDVFEIKSDPNLWALIIMFSGLVSLVTVRVLSGSYFPINKNPKKTIFSLCCIAILNLFIFILNYFHNRSNELIYINLLIFLLFCYLFVLIIFKSWKDKRDEE